MDGVLIVNKPSGPTSHDIVKTIRELTGEKRVGHTGTLDPIAEGVLVICIGKATRISEYLTSSRKKYIAGITFGIRTDTYDIQGQVLSDMETQFLTDIDIIQTLEKYKGKILQTPPQTSAIKKDGVPLYKYARKGIYVEVNPREVEIYNLKLTRFESNKHSISEIEIECSSGTYIRSLINDIGNDIGCGAVMSSLKRIAVANMTIQDAINIDELLKNSKLINEKLISIENSLSDYKSIKVSDEDMKSLIHGKEIILENNSLNTEKEIKVLNSKNELVGMCVVTCNNNSQSLKPRKIFVSLR